MVKYGGENRDAASELPERMNGGQERCASGCPDDLPRRCCTAVRCTPAPWRRVPARVHDKSGDPGALPPPNAVVPRYNIAPTQTVITVTDDGTRHLEQMRWGLIPLLGQGREARLSLINARAETLAEKPAFRTALKRPRCLIPANSFYSGPPSPGDVSSRCGSRWRRVSRSRLPGSGRMDARGAGQKYPKRRSVPAPS